VITISRHKARLLRSVFRRAVLGIRHKGTIPPLVLHAEGAHLRVRHQYGSLAVEYLETGHYHPLDSIPVPLDVLADIEGRDDSPVILEAVEPDRTIVRWQDRGIPQVKDLPVTPFGNIEPFPDSPCVWTEAASELLTGLAEASGISTDDTTRYALNCIQLRGSEHKIVATDGHQLLISSGFDFPWDGDLLISGSPVFACKAFNGGQPLQVAKTDSHVVARIGPWTIWNQIQKDARFPAVEEAISATDVPMTRLHVDHEDGQFLQSTLDCLPGNEEFNRPTTIDMNGKDVIRAQDAEQSHITELVLNRSSYTGPAIRVNSNREFLSRALRLGFHDIGISSVAAPIVCRSPDRIYAWQPLSGDAAIEPTENVLRIEVSTISSEPRQERPRPVTPRGTMNDRVTNNGQDSSIQPSDNGHGTSDTPGSSLIALIQDAEALHKILTEARSSTARLITGLRRHRKQSRLLNETLKSLRQLKLTETAE
jgi:hypothetical protein